MSCGSRPLFKDFDDTIAEFRTNYNTKVPDTVLPLFRRRDDKNKPKIVDALLRRFADFAFKTLTADELKSAIKNKDDLDPIERDPIDTDTLDTRQTAGGRLTSACEIPEGLHVCGHAHRGRAGQVSKFHSAAQRRFGRAVQNNGRPTPEQLRSGAETPA